MIIYYTCHQVGQMSRGNIKQHVVLFSAPGLFRLPWPLLPPSTRCCLCLFQHCCHHIPHLSFLLHFHAPPPMTRQSPGSMDPIVTSASTPPPPSLCPPPFLSSPECYGPQAGVGTNQTIGQDVPCQSFFLSNQCIGAMDGQAVQSLQCNCYQQHAKNSRNRAHFSQLE